MGRLITALALLLLGWTNASAQDAHRRLESRIRPGDLLTVDVRGSGAFEGRLQSATPDLLTIELGDTSMSIPYSDIDRVRRRRNGASLGSAIGLGFGTFVGLGMRSLANAEGRNGEAFLVALAGAGLTLGYLFDRELSLNRTVYKRPAGSVRLEVTPAPRGAVLGIRAAW